MSKYGGDRRSSFCQSTGFVPFGANLTHFGAKPTIPGGEKKRSRVRTLDQHNGEVISSISLVAAQPMNRLKLVYTGRWLWPGISL